VPLLRLAAPAEGFIAFLTALSNHILDVSSYHFTAHSLAKPDGGIRPIAVGELLYRLSMKAIARRTHKPDCLLPNQFGVGSRGGVEPLIHAIRLALAQAPEIILASLRARLQERVQQHRPDPDHLCVARFLPELFKAARWAYATPSDLIVKFLVPAPDGTFQQTIPSSQGVRQGDPLGPLLFSLAIRPFLCTISATTRTASPPRACGVSATTGCSGPLFAPSVRSEGYCREHANRLLVPK